MPFRCAESSPLTRPLPARIPLIRAIDYMLPFWTYYEPRERQLRTRARDETLTIVEEALSTEPQVVPALDEYRKPKTEYERILAEFHAWYAETLDAAGSPKEAVRALDRGRLLRRVSTHCRSG